MENVQCKCSICSSQTQAIKEAELRRREGGSSCWLLPFINIHYLTPPADGNMLIRNYLKRRRISYSSQTRDNMRTHGCKNDACIVFNCEIIVDNKRGQTMEAVDRQPPMPSAHIRLPRPHSLSLVRFTSNHLNVWKHEADGDECLI